LCGIAGRDTLGKGAKPPPIDEKKKDLFQNSKKMQLDEARKILDCDDKKKEKTWEEVQKVNSRSVNL
jgi:hypothetical protein